MPLPTVLMTDVVRSTHQGESHGGAYLIDLEAGTSEQVIDWNEIDINWEGRGAGRGLRGIAYHNGEVYIAASDELFVFDRSFTILRSFRNPYLRHCHEVFLEGDRLFLTSTSFNAILEFDIPSSRFVAGVWIDTTAPKKGPQGAQSVTFVPRRFDPNARGGPAEDDRLHLNMVWRHQGVTLTSGLHVPMVFAIDGVRLSAFARIPKYTHNCRPHEGGMLFNATGQDTIQIADRQGRVQRRFEVPKLDPAELAHTDIPEDYARQGFGRGLCVTDDGLIVGGSSPSTVSVYDPNTTERLASVTVSRDVRNCPHGLAVWPF